MHILCKVKNGWVGEIVSYSNDSNTVSVLFPNDFYSKCVPKEDIIKAEVIINE